MVGVDVFPIEIVPLKGGHVSFPGCNCFFLTKITNSSHTPGVDEIVDQKPLEGWFLSTSFRAIFHFHDYGRKGTRQSPTRVFVEYKHLYYSGTWWHCIHLRKLFVYLWVTHGRAPCKLRKCYSQWCASHLCRLAKSPGNLSQFLFFR